MATKETYLVRFEALKDNTRPARSMALLLKRALRSHGFKATWIGSEMEGTTSDERESKPDASEAGNSPAGGVGEWVAPPPGKKGTSCAKNT